MADDERERSRDRPAAEPRYGLRTRPAAPEAAKAPRRELSAATRELLEQVAGATTIGQAIEMGGKRLQRKRKQSRQSNRTVFRKTS